MLDTDHVSYAIRGHGNVGHKILAHRPSEICISALTVAELRYGADRRHSHKLHGLIDIFTENIEFSFEIYHRSASSITRAVPRVESGNQRLQRTGVKLEKILR